LSPKDLVLYFARGWGERYGKTYLISWGKETAQAKRILQNCTPEEAKSYVDYFLFRYPSSFADRAGRTFPVFVSQLNAVVAEVGEEKKKQSLTESPDYAELEKARKENT